MLKPFLEAGKIVTTHGLKGEVKVFPWTDSPEELLDIDVLYFNKGQTPVEIETARLQGNMALLKFQGIDTIEEAQGFRGKILYADRKDIPLEEGQYFIQDIIGLRVLDADDGRLYGTVADVSKTGANDVYHIQFADGKIRLVPKIPEVVLKISPEEGEMIIRPLKGLYDDEN